MTIPSLSFEWLEKWSSPYINHFLQPDTIIPDPSNPQSWNRYSYVTNRPVNFNDPTGHKETTDTDGGRMREEEPCLVGDLACQLEKGGYKQKSKEQIIKELDGLRPDGWKRSITLSAGFPSNLNANGKKVPTVLYGGLSLVTDNHGGIQLFYETLDIEFNPTLQLNPGEQAQPSELVGIGISATKGPIWRTDEEPFMTSNYTREAHSSGGSWGIVTADYYQSFPNPNIKGLDVGVSAGSPSLWSISTLAIPIFGRIDLTPWQDP